MNQTKKKTLRPVPASSLQQRFPWLYAFWKFSRPHTIIGTSLSVCGIYLITLATATAPLSSLQPTALILPLIACLCGNVYIVGLNQLTDIAIDRINKPHLPLASGEFSPQQGQLIVAVTGLLALGLAAISGPYLLGLVTLSLAIGTAYSLPPLRLKRFPFWASTCIFTVRGAIVNLGLFLHFHQGWPIPLPVWALTAFVMVFTFAIAIFKDIPDIAGDRQYNIRTLTIRFGQPAVFNLARWIITGCYVGMVALSPWLTMVNPPLLIISHLSLLALMWWRSRSVDLSDQRAIAQFYQFIWQLFFGEYLLFPLACLWH
jgi:homogentisate phytyltransferase / homogentisate geranylgeranyltransferase